MIAADQELPEETEDFLWSFVDLVFNEYIEDRFLSSPSPQRS